MTVAGHRERRESEASAVSTRGTTKFELRPTGERARQSEATQVLRLGSATGSRLKLVDIKHEVMKHPLLTCSSARLRMTVGTI